MGKRAWMSDEGVPMPHDVLCKIPEETGDLFRHVEQLWDEVKRLKEEIDKLKRKSEGMG